MRGVERRDGAGEKTITNKLYYCEPLSLNQFLLVRLKLPSALMRTLGLVKSAFPKAH